jgi:TIR domain-containing protein
MSTIAPNEYWFDVFISYSGSGVIKPWVINYFHPRLHGWLREELGREPRVFLDEQDIPRNEHWPEGIRDRLLHSKCLVPVLSGRYFYSEWCLSEWSNFVEREKRLGLYDTRESLIVPAIYHDGKKFPEEAKRYNPFDFRKCGSDSPNFANLPNYHLFEQTVRDLAEAVAEVVERPLTFNPAWPVSIFTPENPTVPLMRPE